MYVKNTIEELEDEIRKLQDRCDELEIEVSSLERECERLDDETEDLWTIIYRIADVIDLEPKLLDPKSS